MQKKANTFQRYLLQNIKRKKWEIFIKSLHGENVFKKKIIFKFQDRRRKMN